MVGFSLRSSFCRQLLVGMLCLAASSPVQQATAASVQRIQFDTGNVVACQDITPAFSGGHDPQDRIVEARLAISVLAQPLPGKEITELLLRIESPECSMQVVDYLPKTTLTSDFVGPMNVEQHREQSQSLEFNFGAHTATAQAAAAGMQQSQAKYQAQGQQLPPLVLCAASGTILRGHGVYFKLCPTTRTSIEGSHDLVLRLRVPASWRADLLLVSCEAFGLSGNVLGAPPTRIRLAAKSFIVAAHLDGDAIAKSRAASLVRAERELRDAANANQRQLQKMTTADPLRDLESFFKSQDRRIPENWLEQTLFGATTAKLPFVDKLPTDVRTASLNFRDLKRQMLRMNSSSVTASPASWPATPPSAVPPEATRVGFQTETNLQPVRLPPVES